MENINNTIKEYFEALNRLIDNKPINVPIRTKITNDSVSLEAGRKKGTIKKSREIFIELIEEIHKASEKEKKPLKDSQILIDKYKAKAKEYQKLYFESLNRELMLIEKLNEIEKLNKKPKLTMKNRI